jgi:anthranilate phosphoribosyltransferase
MTHAEQCLARLKLGQNLAQEEMILLMDGVMRGECPEEQIADLLTALHDKGESVEEIAGAAIALRRHMTPIRHQRTGVVDTCGTGGDGSRTFNISTAAAIVVAAAGVPVAKHGNRSITSRTGSADVLAELGVKIDACGEVVERCLNELGVCFCFAPQLHPAMKHVAAVRKRLPFPTIFNLLGPLCNPAQAPFQVLGVGKQHLHALLASALALLEPRRALVVHGEDGLDEVTLGGATNVFDVKEGRVCGFTWSPVDFGMAQAGRETMRADSPAESAAIIRRVLAGEAGPPRDIVVLNAAAALWTAGRDASPAACARLAEEAIDRGAAAKLLERLADMTHRN